MLHLHLLLQPELQVEWSALSHTDLMALQSSGLSSGLVPALCWVSLLRSQERGICTSLAWGLAQQDLTLLLPRPWMVQPRQGQPRDAK